MAHVHDILDTDKRLSINPITRAITNESENTKLIFMQYDHNSERITFELPRLIEGHDMSLSTVAQIHYEEDGVYEADDLQVSPDDPDKVIFSWVISRDVTKKAKTITFLAKLRCYENGNIVYEWNSAKYSKFTIGDGMDNGEVIIQEYPDVLESLKTRVDTLEEIIMNIRDKLTTPELGKAILDLMILGN